jgi:hypothetical protein
MQSARHALFRILTRSSTCAPPPTADREALTRVALFALVATVVAVSLSEITPGPVAPPTIRGVASLLSGTAAASAANPGSLVFLFLATVLLTSSCSTTAAFVDHVTIVNRTAYDAHVTVRGGGGELGLAEVQARSRTTVEQVLDQGDAWTFSFSYQGCKEATTVKRRALKRRGWTVEVPRSCERRLRQRGVPTPA